MFLKVRWIPLLTVFVLTPLLTTAVSAGPNENAKILIHLAPTTTKNACTPVGGIPTCAEIVTAGDLYPQTYFAYLMVTDGDSAAGIAGIQCGIDYNGTASAGVDVYSWTNCATLEFPSGGWPAAGSGNLITWNSNSDCQRIEPGGFGTGVATVAGYFYCAAYGPDTLGVRTLPVDGLAKVSDCSANEDVLDFFDTPVNPSPLGIVAFSPGASQEGYNPCEPCEPSGLKAVLFSDKSEVTIGVIEQLEGFRKQVYLRGRLMKSPFRVTYSGGASFINGQLWRPDTKPGTRKPSRRKTTLLDFSKLSDRSREKFSRIPFVVNRVSQGASLEQASQEFYARMLKNRDDVVKAYKEKVGKHGVAKASQYSRQQIDPLIAETNTNGPHSPQFSANGHIEIYYFGFGYLMAGVSRADGGLPFNRGLPPPESGTPITIAEAKADFQQLSEYLRAPSTTAIVYSRTGQLLVAGPAAEEVLNQVDAIRKGVLPAMDPGAPRALSQPEIDEFLKENQ